MSNVRCLRVPERIACHSGSKSDAPARRKVSWLITVFRPRLLDTSEALRLPWRRYELETNTNGLGRAIARLVPKGVFGIDGYGMRRTS